MLNENSAHTLCLLCCLSFFFSYSPFHCQGRIWINFHCKFAFLARFVSNTFASMKCKQIQAGNGKERVRGVANSKYQTKYKRWRRVNKANNTWQHKYRNGTEQKLKICIERNVYRIYCFVADFLYIDSMKRVERGGRGKRRAKGSRQQNASSCFSQLNEWICMRCEWMSVASGQRVQEGEREGTRR